jgi:hypothetical protein
MPARPAGPFGPDYTVGFAKVGLGDLRTGSSAGSVSLPQSGFPSKETTYDFDLFRHAPDIAGSDDVASCAGLPVTWFRDYFWRIYPTGIVISELEYRAGTTSPFGPPKGLRTPQQPGLDAVLDSLQGDFRNWVKDLDYRKMRCPWHIDGLNAELLEVTTGTNAAGAIGQIAKKIDILRNTVSRIHNLRLQCYPSRWQPNEYQRFRILNSDQN